jgi:hypothetical protein
LDHEGCGQVPYPDQCRLDLECNLPDGDSKLPDGDDDDVIHGDGKSCWSKGSLKKKKIVHILKRTAPFHYNLNKNHNKNHRKYQKKDGCGQKKRYDGVTI